MSSPTHWSLPFLQTHNEAPRSKTALIILNQPFSKALLRHLWHATDWHCCADGGANRLHDVLNCDTGDAIDTTITTASAASDRVDDYLPDLLKGDLDSVREDVRRYYETRVSRFSCIHVPTHFLLPLPERGRLLYVGVIYFRSHVSVLFRKGVRVVRDDDQNSTDLMKCIRSLQEKEEADGVDVGGIPLPFHHDSRRSRNLFPFSIILFFFQIPYDVVLLCGFSGRLDQTVHLLSYLHKLRKSGRRLFAVADENVGWVLDEARDLLCESSTPRLTVVPDGYNRVNTASPSTTQY
jgi:thiamine pyrophosphokinase